MNQVCVGWWWLGFQPRWTCEACPPWWIMLFRSRSDQVTVTHRSQKHTPCFSTGQEFFIHSLQTALWSFRQQVWRRAKCLAKTPIINHSSDFNHWLKTLKWKWLISQKAIALNGAYRFCLIAFALQELETQCPCRTDIKCRESSNPTSHFQLKSLEAW